MIFSLDPAKRCQFWGKNMQVFLDVLQQRMDDAAKAGDKDKLRQWTQARTFLASFGQKLTMLGLDNLKGPGLLELEHDLEEADNVMIMMIKEKG